MGARWKLNVGQAAPHEVLRVSTTQAEGKQTPKTKRVNLSGQCTCLVDVF